MGYLFVQRACRLQYKLDHTCLTDDASSLFPVSYEYGVCSVLPDYERREVGEFPGTVPNIH